MSWLSIPLPNPFKSLQISDEDVDIQHTRQSSPQNSVKGDFSAIGVSITRQLRGVAAFLAPPPLAGDSSDAGETSGDGSATIDGIRSDLAEIGGSFKNSLLILSSNSTVAGISKLASNFLQLNDDGDDEGDRDGEIDDDGEGIGITDEVVEFVNRISNRPELWIDFPLSLNNKVVDLSETQLEHASLIEQLVPQLADLRSKLAGVMSDNHFWMIYFILLLPRLNNDDYELLSTPKIVEARELLLQMLDSKNGPEIDSEITQSPIGEKVVNENTTASSSENKESKNAKKLTEEDVNRCASNDHSRTDANTDGTGTSIRSCSKETCDNSIIRTTNEECTNDDNLLGKQAVTTRTFQSEDDVSFSDLEVEDDDYDLPVRRTGSGITQTTRPPSPEGSNEWVQLNKNDVSKGVRLRDQSSSRDRDSEGYESSDWLTVDDFDP